MNPAEYEVMRSVEDHHWWYVGLRAIFCRAWSRTGLAPNASLLDIGCGTGALLDFMRARARIFGGDVSLEALSSCRSRNLERLTKAQIQAMPFADGSFDAVSAMDVLCHRDTGTPADCLKELARVVRPGGWILLNLPAYQWLLSPHDVAVHNSKRFTRQQTLSTIAEAGLTPVWVTHWNTVLFAPIVITRLLRATTRTSVSDLTVGNNTLVNSVGNTILSLERRILKVSETLPFGLSIFALARKGE